MAGGSAALKIHKKRHILKILMYEGFKIPCDELDHFRQNKVLKASYSVG